MSHERKCVEKARKRRLTVCLLLAIIRVFTWSLWLNNWLRKYVFVKLMNVTICDLHGHRRSQVVVGTERLYRAPNYK